MMLILHCSLIFIIAPLVLSVRSSSTDRVIHVLTRALNFFATHIDEVNLDAGIGTRMAADQLRAYTTQEHGPSVKTLVDLSEYVTRKILHSVRYRQPDYYNQLSFLLKPGVFSAIVPFRNHPVSKIEKRCSSSPFIEKRSDQCLHALAYAKCNQTESCTKLMSDSHACRYSLTHQILYSIIVKNSPCSLNRLQPADEHRLVAKMLAESQAIAEQGFLETDRDLFMEQIAIGGLLGWNEFFEQKNWLQSIIDWQHPVEGCYGNDTISINKREEMRMSHYCLSHRTSVAIAALSQILRHLLSRDI